MFSGALLRLPAPLLEEEWNTSSDASIAQLTNPNFLQWPRAAARLPSYNEPVDLVEGEFSQRAEERLGGDPAYGRVRFTKHLRTPGVIHVLDRDSEPDMRRALGIRITPVDVAFHSFRALGQDLEYMSLVTLHLVENLVDELVGDIAMEQITHRVDEDPPRLPPVRRVLEPLRMQHDLMERVAESREFGVLDLPRIDQVLRVAVVASR